MCARELPQLDYKTDQPIIIMWPDESPPSEPVVDFYYNERLVKYPASLFGHNAININGNIYNFSHLMNENEIITPEEFIYRRHWVNLPHHRSMVNLRYLMMVELIMINLVVILCGQSMC